MTRKLNIRVSWFSRHLAFQLTMLLCWAFAMSESFSQGLDPVPDSANDFLQRHCYDCHAGVDGEAGLDLLTLVEPTSSTDVADASRDPVAAWTRILDRVRDGEMPPEEAADLQAGEAEAFWKTTGEWLREYQRRQSDSIGRVTGRRLTNLQLERTLHDLLGIDRPIAIGFSDETRVGGFSTVAEGQAMSHFQIEQHLRAVDASLQEAYRRVGSEPDTFDKTFYPKDIARRRPGQRNREPELREGLAAVWSSRLIFYGRMAVTTVPADGWYQITIKASAIKSPENHGVWCSVRTGPCVSNAPLLQTLGGFEATEEPSEWTFEGWLPKGHMFEVRPADANLSGARFNGGQVGAGEGEPQNVPGVAMHWVKVQRVHRGPDDAGVRKRLFGDLQVKVDGKGTIQIQSDQPKEDSARLIHDFAERAFRRPVSDAEVQPYIQAAHQMLEQGELLADAIRGAYRAVLCSPRFLYFTESPGELDDHAVASRLSYFLWSRMPDQTLRDLADRGQLRQPTVIREQVRRMLDDPRGSDFVKDFADQWLDLAEIDFTEPDPRLYRDFDPMVQHAMLLETHTYLQRMLDQNLPVRYLIDSEYTMLNSRLARFYGIDDVAGDEVRLVRLSPSDHRGGLLTHGSILKITANGTTTSPVIRGVWISERLLGQEIPAPPTNVPAIEPDIRGATTIREQLAKHIASDTCASCHVKIDPPGFALENYDPAGKWRDKYAVIGGKAKQAVDPSHQMPDGEPFANIEQFKQLVLRHPERLAHGLTEKLMTYSTGATIRFADRQAIAEIVEQASDSEYGFRSLVELVATSPLFLTK